MKKVQVLLANNVVEDGYLIKWDKLSIVLKSLMSENELHIINPYKNVLAIRFIKENQISEPDLYEEEVELKAYSTDPSLRFKELADLRKMQKQQEQERIRKKLTTFTPLTISDYEERYGQPNLARLQSPNRINYDTRKKIIKRKSKNNK